MNSFAAAQERADLRLGSKHIGFAVPDEISHGLVHIRDVAADGQPPLNGRIRALGLVRSTGPTTCRYSSNTADSHTRTVGS
jgi:hypothetical protein